MNRIFTVCLFIASLLGIYKEASASHIYGGDIKYSYVSTTGTNHTYKITLILYGDCSGGAFTTFYGVCNPIIEIYKDGTFQTNLSLNQVAAESNIEITPVCPDEANNTKCSTPPGTNPGIKKFTYSADYVCNGTGNWAFLFNTQLGCSSAGRSGQIQNLTAAGSTALIATLKNTSVQNSSPNFTAPPTPFFCVNKESTYNLGAVDPDADQMVYLMTPALNNGAYPPPTVTYAAPYTFDQPFPFAAGTFSYSNITGQMNFTPTNPSAQPQFQSIVANKVVEIRGGDTVGTCMREMTFVFLNNCDNTAPADTLGNPQNASIIADTSGELIVQTCEGQTGNVSFDITANDPDGDNITVTSNNLPTGATATVVNDGTPNPTFTFSWDISTNVAAGDYTFFITFTDDGCPLAATKTISKTIRILPFEGGLLTGARSPCEGASNGAAWLTQIVTDTNHYTIIWTNTFGDTLQTAYSNQGDSLLNLVPGVYNVIAINANGCSKFFNVGVLPPYYGAAITAPDTLGCIGDEFSFQNSSYGDLSNFTWTFGDGSPPSSAANPTHIYVSPGTYTVRLTGITPLGCRDTAYVNIMVDSAFLPPFLTNKDSICVGDQITFYPDVGDFNETNLSWDFGGDVWNTTNRDSVTHTFDQAGTYPVTLNVTYRSCPPNTVTRNVYVYPFPVVYLGPDSVMCLDGPALTLQNQASNPSEPYRYAWSTGATTPAITVTEPGTYRLTVASRFDCATTESVIVNKDCYIDIPNSFTPNGDGVNDYFFPRQLLGKSIQSFSMKVFNRWGQVVFETTKTDGRGWDGKFNDKDQPSGVYIYQMQATLDNGKQEKYTGNVTLLR